MGGKKNKRGSIPSTPSASKTEMIERTPENDYGVLSDPEENEPFNPVHLLTETEEAVTDPSTTSSPQPTVAAEQPTEHGDDEYSHSRSEPSQLTHVSPHVSPHSSPSLQPQHPSSPPTDMLSQDPTSKSLSTLKLKLTTDKNYSRKITLHTFFSYIILAIEIERASSSCIAVISAHNVEELIEYMIDNHSATEDIKKYLHTLFENDVIKNIISAVIEFNKDQSAYTLDALLSAEQMELEMVGTAINTETIPVTIGPAPQPAPQTSHNSCGFFKCFRRFFSGCCGNSR